MTFKMKKIGENQKYDNFYDMIKNHLSVGLFIKLGIVLASLCIMYIYASYAVNFTKDVFKQVTLTAVKTISSVAGEEMKKDELGQINVLLLGYGGEGHNGSFLTDSMMIASFNPKLGTVSMLSVPRDLIITSKYYNGKLNGIFAMAYNKNKSFDEAANALRDKFAEMLGIKTDYYMMADFKGFRQIVDSLGGIDVDVPENFIDTQYPNDETWTYETFSVKKGMQHFDGNIALKYARSRHSTSDFSRSLRQEQIIRAIFNKMVAMNYFTNVDKMKQIYGLFNSMVKTNISFKNVIGMAKYIDDIKHFFSFSYGVCDNGNYKVSDPGCLLYYPPREAFGGASTVLPQGATPSNISYYKYMQDFAYNVIYQQGFLLENAGIRILSGQGKMANTRKKGVQRLVMNQTKANTLANRLKIMAFNVQDVDNAPKISDKNVLFVNGTGNYSATIDALKMFVNIDEVTTGSITFLTGKNSEMIPNDLTLILGR